MRRNGHWKRRGFAIAAIAFTFSVVALDIAAPVGAAPSPTGIALTARPAGQLQATGPAAKAKALAKANALAKAKAFARARAVAKAKAKRSSLSLPQLLFFAVAPFLLMGGYLLGADYLRNRPPKKHRASLIITRVSNR